MTMLMIATDGRTLSYDVSGAGAPICSCSASERCTSRWNLRVLAFQPNLCVPKTRFCKLVMKAAEDGRRYDAAHVLDGAMRSASVCVGGCRARR